MIRQVTDPDFISAHKAYTSWGLCLTDFAVLDIAN